MDNIYDYLKADHRKVSELFKYFEKSPTMEGKADFVNMIITELLVHAESEQATFYKELEKYRSTEDEVFHGEEEHAEIEDKIAEIIEMKTLNKAWEDKVYELKKLVDHHVSEEENDIFKRAKKVLSDEESYIIREHMHDLKEKILTEMDKLASEEA